MSSTARTTRLARLEALEKVVNSDTGMMVFATLCALGSLSDRVVPVVACEVGPQQSRVRFERLPDETLDQLHKRANPRRSWRAHPTPVFGNS